MSLEPAKVNFTVWRGAAFTKRILWRDGAADAAGKDLTDYTGSLIIRDPSGNVMHTMTTENGGMYIDPTGFIDLLIPAATTTGFFWTTGLYKLLVIPPNNQTDVFFYGGFAVKDA